MSSNAIFLKVENTLAVLRETPYDSKAVLQTALAEYPEVLAGPTTEGDGTGRLLFLTQEMPVPNSADGTGAQRLDHLFLDQEGVPVLVEVKRSSDARIRREVVGQMLDYAANAVKYWPVSTLQAALGRTAAAKSTTAEELIRGLDGDVDVEEFWKTVEANLLAGRIRMLFVADALPPELVRVVEFLNEQMSPAEVLGVELRQFVHDGHVAYVPQVVGRTSAAISQKARTGGQQWTEATFLDAARSRCTDKEQALIERLLDHARRHGTKLSWGKGLTPGVGAWYSIEGTDKPVWVLNVNSDSPTTRPYLVFYLADLAKTPTGWSGGEAAAQHLETIPAMKAKVETARANDWNKYPSVYLPDVAEEPDSLRAVVDAIEALIR
jgi:hypothetical protein